MEDVADAPSGRRGRRPRRRAPRGERERAGAPGSRCPAACAAGRCRSGSGRRGGARRGLPGHGDRLDVEHELVVAVTGSSSPAASITTLGEVDRLADGTRPTSARASSRRSATRRRMRCEERSAERAASRVGRRRATRRAARGSPGRRQRGAQLVEASATNCALAGRASPRSRAGVVERGAFPPACARARRSRRRPSARAAARSGRACGRSPRRVRVSSAIGAIARRAIARPASSASALPPRTPNVRAAARARRSCAGGGGPGGRTGGAGCGTAPSATGRCPTW